MKHTVWLIIFLLKDVAAMCDEGWQEFREMCYYVSPKSAFHNYAGALNLCEADLASVTSQEITDFIIKNMRLPDNYTAGGCGFHRDCDPEFEFWIGLTKNITGVDKWETNITRFQTGWKWQAEREYEWQNWRDGEPAFDEGYARMRGDGSWGGTFSREKYRYICQQEANDSKTKTTSATTTLPVPKMTPNSTQSPTKSSSSGSTISVYVGPAIGVLVAIVIVVIVIVLCRKRRVAKESHQNEMYYNTRGELNNRPAHNPNKTVNIQADSGNQYAYDNQLPPGHNSPPPASGSMYAEIDKGGQRNSMQGPPAANKPVDNGRISAMYAQPDLTAKRNRRNLKTDPDEEVTLVENSTYATTLPK